MRLSLLGLILTFVGIQPAQALIEPLVLVPAQPIAGETFYFTVRHGSCDSIFVPDGGGADDRFRQIAVVGNIVRVTVIYSTTSPPTCSAPTVTSQIFLNPLPAGSYQLELIGRPAGNSNLPNQLLQSVPLQVVPAPLVVPSLSSLGLLATLVLLVLAGGFRLRSAP